MESTSKLTTDNIKTPLTGKVVLVTGGSRGIGEATARRLAKAGMKVVIASRSEEDMKRVCEGIHKDGGEACYIICDVEKESDIENAVTFTKQKYDRIDVVFANAGWEGPMGDIDEATPANIRRLFDINLIAPILFAKFAIPIMKKDGGGFVILNSSIGAVISADVGRLPMGFHLYSVTKAALNHFCRMMTRYEKDKIYTFAVLPSIVETSMLPRVLTKGESQYKTMGITDSSSLAIFNPEYRGKPGRPGHVAEVVLTLIDGTTLYKSGDCIVIDHEITWNAHEFYKTLCIGGLHGNVPNKRNIYGQLLEESTKSHQ